MFGFQLNPSNSIKELLRRIARHCGYVIQRYDPLDPLARCSLKGSMQVVNGLGFTPKTIIDVGAARGSWSAEVSSIWPESYYIMLDPLKENEEELKCVRKKIKHADYMIVAITDHSGEVSINVHPDLEGSSIFREREDSINGFPRVVKSLNVDDLVNERGLNAPILLKADVQGAEIQVLLGAKHSLPSIDVIILEVLLFDIYQGSNFQLFETVSFLMSNGFVAWDIFGMGYRMLDNALCQVDMVFVKNEGLFRKFHQYANKEQRYEQLATIKRDNPKRFKQQ
jgi:FkbM family methyltransferase